MPKEVEESPPHRDDTFARTLPLVGELHPEHRPAVPGAPTGLLGRPSSSCLEGGPSARVIAELAPRADELVLATVIGGFNREYRMLVVEDGVATLDIIRRARVLSAKELGDMLRSTP
jgi:hypothetical protein